MSVIMPFVPEQIAQKVLASGAPINREEWQSDAASHKTYELDNVILEYHPQGNPTEVGQFLGADLPWAEKHFQERISGKPLNPPPSAEEWPWHQAAKDKHTKNTIYSHTYPERFWPKWANDPPDGAHGGIRYGYGDFEDLIRMLNDRPWTRQAYLPIFFPEDTGAPMSQRVPCTLGYHFIRNRTNLDCNYFIRSCDMTRHLRNDMYMAARLLQFVQSELCNYAGYPEVGKVTMFISNLHIFENDVWRWVK